MNDLDLSDEILGESELQSLVVAAVSFVRAEWRVAFDSTHSEARRPREGPEGELEASALRDLFQQEYRRAVGEFPSKGTFARILSGLRKKSLYRAVQGDKSDTGDRRVSWYVLNLRALSLSVVCRALLSDFEREIWEYLVRRLIRMRHRVPLTPQTVRVFHSIASRIDTIGGRKQSERRWGFREFRRIIEAAIGDDLDAEAKTASRELFFESCLLVDYVWPSHVPGYIDMRTLRVDAEYLLSQVYSVPTGIPGFDELFGGGLVLSEDLFKSSDAGHDDHSGRSILINGTFGIGKSILALQLAVAVAKHGGVAVAIILEQRLFDYEFMLYSATGAHAAGPLVVRGATNAVVAINQRRAGQGVLVLLGDDEARNEEEEFLRLLLDCAKWLDDFPLRVLVVDPISAIYDPEPHAQSDSRRALLRALNLIKFHGTNVILVVEENSGDKQYRFIDAVTDTIIHLCSDAKHGYAQRYVEIRKSRLQREQRGLHPFSIIPGRGFRIVPSTAAVAARVRARSLRGEKVVVEFGHPALDKLLGEDALHSGDVLSFAGPTGTFRTPLGILFLMGFDFVRDKRRSVNSCSLFVSARHDREVLERMVGERYVTRYQGYPHTKQNSRIRLLSIPRGFVRPGTVFELVSNAVDDARASGLAIDRILIDGVTILESSFPFVKEDAAFASTLVDYLRRLRVTTLFICGPADKGGDIERVIIESSDCHVTFETKVESPVVFAQIMKTHTMTHERRPFRVGLHANEFVFDLNW